MSLQLIDMNYIAVNDSATCESEQGKQIRDVQVEPEEYNTSDNKQT